MDLDEIPVHVLGFDAKANPERALEVEAAENALRRNYTTEEIKAIYARLIVAGYTDREGKPKEGEKAARPAIAAIIGKSTRTVRRLLNKPTTKQTRTSAGLQIILSGERCWRVMQKELRDWADRGKKTPTEVQKLLSELEAPGLERLFVAAKKSLDWKPAPEKSKASAENIGTKKTKSEKTKSEKRSYTQKAPTNVDLDTWAATLGVAIPQAISRRNCWGRYQALVEAAADKFDVDLSGLPTDHWKNLELPALRLVNEKVKVMDEG